MNLKQIKQAWGILKGESIENCVKTYGTKEFTLLVEAISNLEILIKRLENPGRAKKLDRLMKWQIGQQKKLKK